ncbi:hypothetical protein CU669_00935 [Paramagnetospirillum kuznetsovii]|uniref:Uncharacterized protein n=1 Tax=Paramagnetospirillum kuznetsovii TaxID=2053833 RepID=A0A364P2Y7_9PROT|nr:hypothetical protein [Paramagnetospirillum kuznetsovii]RAU23702.1 hypothetical protein CU669_00935 [Paramagnetospirillum kuznetsovii]
MSQLLAEWREKKHREDEQLHDQLRGAVTAGRVALFTDPKVLDFQGSPVHQHWDHLLPLTGLMTLALIVLLATNVVVGIVVMTLCTLAHVFGSRHYVAWRLKFRAQAYMLTDVIQFQTLWQMGGVAMVVKGGNEPPCLAPKGDWRKFIRRNLGEGEAPRREQLANAPVPTQHVPEYTPPPVVEMEPEPDPFPFADAVQPDPVPPQPMEPEAPRTHWESIDDDPPRDAVMPPDHRPQ